MKEQVLTGIIAIVIITVTVGTAAYVIIQTNKQTSLIEKSQQKVAGISEQVDTQDQDYKPTPSKTLPSNTPTPVISESQTMDNTNNRTNSSDQQQNQTTPKPSSTPTPNSSQSDLNKIEEKDMSLREKLAVNKPPMVIDPQKYDYQAKIETSEGNIVIDLNETATPITVNNFAYLAKIGYYDDTVFHRVIEGFMIQGGDPKGDGTGGPNYTFDDEEFSGEYNRGTVAMANSGPNTNGSQFFIMHQDYPLQNNYVIFGQTTKGLNILDNIATSEVKENPFGEESKPLNPVKIINIDIIETQK